MRILTADCTHEFAITLAAMRIADAQVYAEMQECSLRYLSSSQTLEVFTFSDNGRTVICERINCILEHFSDYIQIRQLALYHGNDNVTEASNPFIKPWGEI